MSRIQSIVLGFNDWLWSLLGGRSFLLAYSVLVFATWLCYKHLLSGVEWAGVVGGIAGLVHTRAIFGDRTANGGNGK